MVFSPTFNLTYMNLAKFKPIIECSGETETILRTKMQSKLFWKKIKVYRRGVSTAGVYILRFSPFSAYFLLFFFILLFFFYLFFFPFSSFFPFSFFFLNFFPRDHDLGSYFFPIPIFIPPPWGGRRLEYIDP